MRHWENISLDICWRWAEARVAGDTLMRDGRTPVAPTFPSKNYKIHQSFPRGVKKVQNPSNACQPWPDFCISPKLMSCPPWCDPTTLQPNKYIMKWNDININIRQTHQVLKKYYNGSDDKHSTNLCVIPFLAWPAGPPAKTQSTPASNC